MKRGGRTTKTDKIRAWAVSAHPNRQLSRPERKGPKWMPADGMCAAIKDAIGGVRLTPIGSSAKPPYAFSRPPYNAYTPLISPRCVAPYPKDPCVLLVL